MVAWEFEEYDFGVLFLGCASAVVGPERAKIVRAQLELGRTPEQPAQRADDPEPQALWST